MILLVLSLDAVYVPHVTPHPPIRQVHSLDADLQCHPFIIMHIVTSLVPFWHCKVHNNK